VTDLSPLSIRIMEVENGFVVLDDNPNARMYEGRKWVANTPRELAELVEKMATKAVAVASQPDKEWKSNV
jgi:hypothetical protein